MANRERSFDHDQWRRDIERLPLDHMLLAEVVLAHARHRLASEPYQTAHSRLVESDYKAILYSTEIGRWWLVINSRKDRLRLEFDDPADIVHDKYVTRGRQWSTKGQKWLTLPQDTSHFGKDQLVDLVERIFSAYNSA